MHETRNGMFPTPRTFPNVLIDGVNPFYLIESAYALFDSEELEDGEKVFPLFSFQETLLMLAALYRIILAQAPSQSGKTTVVELLAALMAYAFPGENILILSTKDTQSERLLRDIRNKFIMQCRVPELRKLSKDSTNVLEIAASRSQIIALPHSIGAVTGNPARFVILDEMSKWDKDPHKIYAEAIARTGKTGGQVMGISTFFGEGRPDPKSETGFKGNFYHYKWSEIAAKRTRPDKHEVAVTFTYHVNPYLIRNIDVMRESMSEDFFNEHYLGKPRKAGGRPVFINSYRKEHHLKDDRDVQIMLNPGEALFLCFDPGLNKAAVLGQFDFDAPRLIYLRAWLDMGDKTFGDFARTVVMQVRRDFPEWGIQYFMDVAGRKRNDQTHESNVEVLTQICGQIPVTQWQPVEPGIDIMEGFMRRHGGFVVSEAAPLLHDAFESGLVAEVRNGVTLRRYAKDGYWEHLGDGARYPVYYLSGGMSVDALSAVGAYEVVVNPYIDPLTGY